MYKFQCMTLVLIGTFLTYIVVYWLTYPQEHLDIEATEGVVSTQSI